MQYFLRFVENYQDNFVGLVLLKNTLLEFPNGVVAYGFVAGSVSAAT